MSLLYLTGDLKSPSKNSSHIFCVQVFQVQHTAKMKNYCLLNNELFDDSR